MQKLFNSNFPLLIQGATGTGKSSLAKKIHDKSIYKNRAFVKCNLAGLNENLFESELFGHIKGSFTGALSDKLGFCDLVGDGTFFMDELGELTLMQQKKLLNILDERKYLSVGSHKYKTFSGRFIFATHRDLEEMILKGEFREDLYFRLGGQAILLKPFWRKSDNEKIEFIVKEVKNICEKHELIEPTITKECMTLFTTYEWPGNYREIKNTLELIVLKNEGGFVSESILPSRINGPFKDLGTFNKQISILEKKIIQYEIVNKGIGVNKASKSLGISKTTLIAKMRKYGITVHQFKDKLKYAA